MILPCVEYLDWDSHFFGFPVARVNTDSTNIEDWNEILSQLKSRQVKLIYWLRKPGDHLFKKFANRNHAALVDIKTTYTAHLSDDHYVRHRNIENYKQNLPGKELLDLSVQCGSRSRFAVDKRIPVSKFQELYHLWMARSIEKTMADEVMVYSDDGLIVAMVTVYKKNNAGHIGLIGVDENYRGRGIGKALIDAAKNYFLSIETRKIEVVTQGHNVSACLMYERTGFFVSERFDFYHFWL